MRVFYAINSTTSNSTTIPIFKMKLNLNTLPCAASMLAITPSHAQAPATEVKTEKKALTVSEKSLVGYWAPDEISLRTQLLEQVKPLIAAGQVSAEQIEQQAKKMASVMIVNYTISSLK